MCSARTLSTKPRTSLWLLFAAGMLCGIAAPRAHEASVSFLGTDDTTQGSWKGVYGADGHAIPYKDGKMQGWAKLPDYARSRSLRSALDDFCK